MTSAEAIAAVEFWTTTEGAELAIGSTTNKEAGERFGGKLFDASPSTNPGQRLGWSISVSRHVVNDEGDPVDNPLFAEIMAEIERRRAA